MMHTKGLTLKHICTFGWQTTQLMKGSFNLVKHIGQSNFSSIIACDCNHYLHHLHIYLEEKKSSLYLWKNYYTISSQKNQILKCNQTTDFNLYQCLN